MKKILANMEKVGVARKLPCNVEAEQHLLGAILTNDLLFNQVSDFLKGEHFIEPLHQKIYSGICVVKERGLRADPVTLQSYLSDDLSFERANGKNYLLQLATIALMVIDIRDYGKIIHELALKRSLIEIGEAIVLNAYDSTLEEGAADQIANAEAKLFQLAAQGINEKGFVSIGSSMTSSMSIVANAMKNDDACVGISTGFTALDYMLSGFQNSDLTIIAGRPSMGKTAFAIALAVNSCSAFAKKGENKSVGIFSLEMSAEQLSQRVLSMQTNIDSTIIRSGRLKEESFNQLMKAARLNSKLPIFIDDSPSCTISSIRTKARKLKRKANLGILFIDYLQLIKGSTKSLNRVDEVSEITRSLKGIAKELDIPIIALSQLSRNVEARDDKRPMLADLRDSGSIEQDADIVMFIYREEYYLMRKQPKINDYKRHGDWREQMQKNNNIADIIIAKHRNGPVGSIQLFYDSKLSKFNNLEKNF